MNQHPDLIAMSGEHQSVRNGLEDLCHSPITFRWSLEEPEVSDIFGIEPWFDMGKVTAVDFEPWAQRFHEADDRCRESDSDFVGRIAAEAVVVISPDADRSDFGQ